VAKLGGGVALLGAKATHMALQHAASIAGLMIVTEAMVAEVTEAAIPTPATVMLRSAYCCSTFSTLEKAPH
jgi:hypothetical protein